MADDDFRSYRSRDAMAPRSAATPSRPHSDDPLAELARLIGQSEPPGDYDREARNGPSLDVPAEGVDWAAEDRYADQSEPAEGNYDARGDDRYLPAQQADIVPTYRAGAPYDHEAEPQLDTPFSPPARSFNGARDYALPERSRFRDEQEPVGSLGRQLPGFAPPSRDERDYDDPAQQGAEDQDYALEDYEEEAPAGRRRSGFVVIAAVLGLAVLGTAGAFAYRAMFGSSMLPSLPPIIKADDGPNKIMPTKPKSNASDQADANSPSGEKLVLARGAAGRRAGAGEPDAAGGLDHSDFPRSEFRPSRSSEFRATGRPGLGRAGVPRAFCAGARRRAAGTVCAGTSERYADLRRRRRFGRQPHRSSQAHPLRRWERHLRRRLHPRPRRKRSTRSSSGPIRSGRRRPMRRPPRRLRSRRRLLRRRCGLRPLVPRHSLRQGRCPRRGPRPMARSLSCPIRTAPLRLRASVPRWRVRPNPRHRSAPRRRRRPAAAIPFRSPPSVARWGRRPSSVRCEPSFRPSWAAASR